MFRVFATMDQRMPLSKVAAHARRAEALGYDAAYVDGDVTQLGQRHEADVLDGWTVPTALLARTHRIGVGSIRLVQHWNAACPEFTPRTRSWWQTTP